MATLDWPSTRAFQPASITWGARTPKSTWRAFFTGQRQQVSHAADRLRATLELPPCLPADAGRREAYLLALARTGDWVRLRHYAREAPAGTLRGSPLVNANAAAGATSIVLKNCATGATLIGGDMLGIGGNLLTVAYAGAVEAGGGLMTVPLLLPLRVAVATDNAVTWDKPTGTFQFEPDAVDMEYTAPRVQRGVSLQFTEVF